MTNQPLFGGAGVKPYFTDEQATLYLGDALTVLQSLPDAKSPHSALTAIPHRGGRIMTHECPFSAGDLLALGAIAEARSRQEHAPAGARRLAEMCYEHARLHPVPRPDEEKEG